METTTYTEEPIEGVPIEFKQINKEDFNEHYSVEDKIIIDVSDKGYLDERFKQLLDEDSENINTTVINAGVGQGKTTHIIQKAISFAEKKDYIVVVAVPFNNLIEQYYKDFIKGGFSKYKIFNMPEINNSPLFKSEEINFSNVLDLVWNVNFDDPPYSYSQNKILTFKVHIMTTNTLLGNPGDNSLFTAKNKTTYFQKLITLCQKNNKKLVIIFDEIHDSIHNFKEEYIINLWKFKGLIHKIYVVSATFNEASKEVIKYLSELTQNNIRIIESRRTIVPEKQSRLHLIFYDNKPLSKNKIIVNKLTDLINQNQKFDIIAYSKKQIDQLFSSEKGIESLKNIKNEINFCFSDLFNNDANNKYDAERINIGTNFTTGVNIEKENHSLFVILPKRLNIKYLNNKGVFSFGMNAIIQTFARQRRVGDIYVVLPPPYDIVKSSIPYDNIIKSKIIERFEKFKSLLYTSYTDINNQDTELEVVYQKLLKRAESALTTIHSTDRTGMNPLEFPTKTRFTIEKGEAYLSKNFFGGDLSTYVYFAAITNQFLNCRLTTINYNNGLNFSSENLVEEVVMESQNLILQRPLIENPELLSEEYFNNEDYIYDALLISEYKKLHFLIKYFLAKNYYIDDSPDTGKKVLKIITLLTIHNGDFHKVIDSYENNKVVEKEITEYYFRSCTMFSSNQIIDNPDISLTEDQIFLTYFFQKWEQFLEIIDSLVEAHNEVIPKNPTEEFIDLYTSLIFSEKIDEFNRTDILVKNKVINFSENWRKTKSDKKVDFFYKTLIEFFYDFETKQFKQENGERPRMYTEVKRKNFEGIHNLLF